MLNAVLGHIRATTAQSIDKFCILDESAPCDRCAHPCAQRSKMQNLTIACSFRMVDVIQIVRDLRYSYNAMSRMTSKTADAL